MASHSALAIFQSRPNSHPFQERHVSLCEPVKVGRSVARARPAPNNAIFDCKVLSRNHALLWYDAGKFWLQDTKSSNGTFVNNQRLSKGSEESPPRELFSGDNVQFGVDVMENSRRITHGCIICVICLFHPDGKEAKPSPGSGGILGALPAAHSQEVYQLAQYLQDALHREQLMERKLSDLQSLMRDAQVAADAGWQALIDEDRLLSRIELLESQLQVYAKHHSEDQLRQELVALQSEKHTYEATAKKSMSKALQEKLEAVRRLGELEHSLETAEGEATHLRERCEAAQEELQLLAAKYTEKVAQAEDLARQLQESEAAHAITVEALEQEKTDLTQQLETALATHAQLQAKIEEVEAENSFQKQQIENLRDKLETVKEDSTNSNVRIEDLGGSEADNEWTRKDETDSDAPEEEALRGKLAKAEREVGRWQGLLEESDRRVLEGVEHIAQLEGKLAEAQKDCLVEAEKITAIEVQCSESADQAENTEDLITSLQGRIAELESELTRAQAVRDAVRGQAGDDDDDVSLSGDVSGDDAASDVTIVCGTITPDPVALLKEEMSASEARYAALEEKVEDLGRQLDTSKQDEGASKARLEAYEKETESRHKEIDGLKKQVKELESKKAKDDQAEKSKKEANLASEVSRLKTKLGAAEKEGRAAREEVKKQASELLKLEKAHSALLQQKKELDLALKTNLTDAQKEGRTTRDELATTKEEVCGLRDAVGALEAEAQDLRAELATSADELGVLAHRTRTLSFCAMLPLVMLVLALLTAMSPVLSSLTATHDFPS